MRSGTWADSEIAHRMPRLTRSLTASVVGPSLDPTIARRLPYKPSHAILSGPALRT
jgi:hypothetical protein